MLNLPILPVLVSGFSGAEGPRVWGWGLEGVRAGVVASSFEKRESPNIGFLRVAIERNDGLPPSPPLFVTAATMATTGGVFRSNCTQVMDQYSNYGAGMFFWLIALCLNNQPAYHIGYLFLTRRNTKL
jgi:hypothetical protein